ncbi:MAG TPA: D-alanyl-D-alanine carboxypeptidase family protein [Caulobacteraceae bacterium]
MAASLAPVARAGGENCVLGSVPTALRNSQSVRGLPLDVFHRPEAGWEIYAPLVAHEIGTACDAASPAFAHDLAAWQFTHGLAPSGVMDPVTFMAMKVIWDARRPFVAASLKGCPNPPDQSRLALVPGTQSYGGKTMFLRPGALAAYERMLAAARAESPAVRADPRLMRVFSAFRSPADDDARCLAEGNCQGVVRANCSAHRTGLAMDLDLGTAPGSAIGSADDANRLFISRGPAYRWMVANAGRFGFVNYPFEPWHWEWTGEAP